LNITNSMEQRPSWEADSHSVSKEIPCHLWNLKVWCRKSWVQDQSDSLQSFLYAFPFKQIQNFVNVKYISCLYLGVHVTRWTVYLCSICHNVHSSLGAMLVFTCKKKKMWIPTFNFSRWAEASTVKKLIRIHKIQQWI
jgi:hypothetical protein